MYLAFRDIVFAKGRFALIGGVVALITLLLVLLTGLTDGLGRQNTSALENLGASHIVFAAPDDDGDEPSFTESVITADELRAWNNAASGPRAERLGVTQTRAEAAGTGGGSNGPAASVAVMGLETGTALAPSLESIDGRTHPLAGQAVLSEEAAADLAVSLGDTIHLSSTELDVVGIVGDEYYSHLPVAWTSIDDFAGIAHLGDGLEATALAIPADRIVDSADPPTEDTLASADAAAGTVSKDTRAAFSALPAYQSERGSLLMMQAFLYGISALVVVSFLTVWTIQRTRDLAVLRALGSSRGYLVRDSMTQAAFVVLLGAAAGGAAGVAGGAAVGSAVPFALTPMTILTPVLGVFVLGLIGAALATRRVTRIDPLLALGGN